ncbi:hypothetical protein KQI82_09625 [Oscillibacter sp. MSJ-2]|uniref:Uncharacterized protein n=1 Tax=Dysosmobacter acutus TaxID=2841504 RepID=A0ABS6FA47_9FIRM|nr:hypothetical protein [Dysosmobacter acutus]MBU5627165.1 hypothetical protein [Dysosmobacter acutus]
MTQCELESSLTAEEIADRLKKNAGAWSEKKLWTTRKSYYFRTRRDGLVEVAYTGKIFGAVSARVRLTKREAGGTDVSVQAGVAPTTLICSVILLIIALWLAVMDVRLYGVSGLARDVLYFLIALLGIREALRNRKEIPVLMEFIQKNLS